MWGANRELGHHKSPFIDFDIAHECHHYPHDDDNNINIMCE